MNGRKGKTASSENIYEMMLIGIKWEKYSEWSLFLLPEKNFSKGFEEKKMENEKKTCSTKRFKCNGEVFEALRCTFYGFKCKLWITLQIKLVTRKVFAFWNILWNELFMLFHSFLWFMFLVLFPGGFFPLQVELKTEKPSKKNNPKQWWIVIFFCAAQRISTVNYGKSEQD